MSFSLGSILPVTPILDALGLNVGVTLDGVGATVGGLGVNVTPILSSLTGGSGDPLGIDLSTANQAMPSPAPASSADQALVGTDAGEFLAADNSSQFVYGRSGADTIVGGDGNDHLFGYGATAGPDGADMISGGAGIDYIQGNAGNDTLDGGDGADRIFGGADDDFILGGAGADSVNGNFGADVIYGGAGDDFLRGGKGTDRIFGDDGNDILSGDLGGDTLTGGLGADTFRFSGADAAFIDTDLLTGREDEITDFTDGLDHLSLGFTPDSVLHGTSVLGVAGALTVAQSLLTNLTGGHQVAAVQVGGDTLLFYASSGGLLLDSAIKLDGVNATSIGVADFI